MNRSRHLECIYPPVPWTNLNLNTDIMFRIGSSCPLRDLVQVRERPRALARFCERAAGSARLNSLSQRAVQLASNEHKHWLGSLEKLLALFGSLGTRQDCSRTRVREHGSAREPSLAATVNPSHTAIPHTFC